jgi:hypothetical protein
LSNSCTTIHGTTNVKLSSVLDDDDVVSVLIEIKLDKNTFVSNMIINLFWNDFLFVLIKFVKFKSFNMPFVDVLLRILSTFFSITKF